MFNKSSHPFGSLNMSFKKNVVKWQTAVLYTRISI